MHVLFLLFALEAAASVQPLRLVGCAETFESQLKGDWAIEGVVAPTKVDLTVTCLADGNVELEFPSLHIRRTVDRADDEDVSQHHIVAVIAAELVAEAGLRPLPVTIPAETSPAVVAQSLEVKRVSAPKSSQQKALFSLHAGGGWGVSSGSQSAFQGAFIGLTRGTLWTSSRRMTLAARLEQSQRPGRQRSRCDVSRLVVQRWHWHFVEPELSERAFR